MTEQRSSTGTAELDQVLIAFGVATTQTEIDPEQRWQAIKLVSEFLGRLRLAQEASRPAQGSRTCATCHAILADGPQPAATCDVHALDANVEALSTPINGWQMTMHKTREEWAKTNPYWHKERYGYVPALDEAKDDIEELHAENERLRAAAASHQRSLAGE